MCVLKIKQAVREMRRYCSICFKNKVGVICTGLCRLVLCDYRECYHFWGKRDSL